MSSKKLAEIVKIRADSVRENLLKFKANDILARRYFYPSLTTLPYSDARAMPVSDSIASRILCLPLFSELETEQIKEICDLIKE